MEKKKHSLLIMLLLTFPIVNVLLDFVSYWSEAGGTIALLRGLLIIILIVSLTRNKSLNTASILIFIFLFYTLIQVPTASKPLQSLRISLKSLLPMLFYYLGYAKIIGYYRFERLNINVIWSQGILLLLISISWILGIGNFVYVGEDVSGDDLYLGNFADNISLFTFNALLTPMILLFVNDKWLKRFAIIFGVLIAIIALVSMKRTAMFVLILGFIFWFLRIPLKKRIKTVVSLALFSLLLAPIFLNKLIARYYVRASEGRFSQEGIEEEGRYQETFIVWEEVLSFKDPLKSIFGGEAFNSVGNYGSGRRGGRQLHVDYNLIVNTLGLVGLFIYLSIHWFAFRHFRHFYKKVKDKNIQILYIETQFYVLLFGSLLTSLGGQMYGISFRSLIFIYLGVLTRMIKNISVEQSRQFKNYSKNENPYRL